MESRVFEIHDRNHISCVVATILVPVTDLEQRQLERHGFVGNHVLLLDLETKRTSIDPYQWDNRTLVQAHNFIKENFWSLESGSVIDIEYLLQEKHCKATSIYG